MSIPSIADQLAALRAQDARVAEQRWANRPNFQHSGVADLMFFCGDCKTERKYGWATDPVTDPSKRPFLLCDPCGKHTTHVYSRVR